MTQPDLTKKSNWFVRILIIVLCIFIGGIICFNFFWSQPKAQISAGLLVLVAFLTVLALSEAFDNFSITKLISLSRTVKDKENKNQELTKENTELRNQIITVSTSINQKQINSTFVLTDELAKMFTVKQADATEKKQKEQEIEETQNQPQGQSVRRYISSSKFEDIALPKFLQLEGLHQYPLIRDAKLVSHFQQVDPVSEFSPIFDGYIKTADTEIFIELRQMSRGIIVLVRERLYLMLSKINYYRNLKKATAYLFLVFYRRPDEDLLAFGSLVERLNSEFQPAILNGLLQIRQVDISQEEYDKIIAQQ